MNSFANAASAAIVISIAEAVIENKAYLSEIDGKIGDGDHGVNMAKGFGIAADRLRGRDVSLGEAFDTLGNVLLTEIGGSMGPLYGMMFTTFGEVLSGKDAVEPETFSKMLHAGLEGIQSVGEAKVGDKTLLDALVPAMEAFDGAIAANQPFEQALAALDKAAANGRDSTRDMVARIGRASRLGERSRGVIDAGAASCALILGILARGARERLA